MLNDFKDPYEDYKPTKALLSPVLPELKARNAPVIWTANPDMDHYSGAGEEEADLGFAGRAGTGLSKFALRGYSEDAVEMVAQALVAIEQNPEIKVNFLGESGGGFIAEEAAAIMDELGYQNHRYIGVGTPELPGMSASTSGQKVFSNDEDLGRRLQRLQAAPVVGGAFGSNDPAQNQFGNTIHTVDGYLADKNAYLMDFLGIYEDFLTK